jgi:hypothetical protein
MEAFMIEKNAQRSNEWYTPAKYIEAARTVMGGIDLDPASCAFANMTVRATRYYTTTDNGLVHAWIAKSVWLNPPFGRTRDYGSNIKLFTLKLLEEYKKGNVAQAILLSTLRVETPWFQHLWEFPICFANHNVRFIRNYDTPGKPGRYTTGHIHGTIFVYLGPNESRFMEHFSKFGRIVRAIDTPPVKPTMRELWEVTT